MAGFGVAYLAARAIGLAKGTGLRTFAVSAGICNYSYLPLPIVGGIWGERAQGLVLVHNLGVDLALWSVGLLILTGASPREGWRKLVTPMLVTLLVAVAINVCGLAPHVPGFVGSMARSLGVCAVPIGLLMTGVNLADYLDEPSKLLHRNVALAACVVRLGIMPVLMLCFARRAAVLRRPEARAGRRGGDARGGVPDHHGALLRRPAAHRRPGRPLDDRRRARRLPALDPRGLCVARRRLGLAFARGIVPWLRR